jgi:hypothetical protein
MAKFHGYVYVKLQDGMLVQLPKTSSANSWVFETTQVDSLLEMRK